MKSTTVINRKNGKKDKNVMVKVNESTVEPPVADNENELKHYVHQQYHL